MLHQAEAVLCETSAVPNHIDTLWDELMSEGNKEEASVMVTLVLTLKVLLNYKAGPIDILIYLSLSIKSDRPEDCLIFVVATLAIPLN